MSFFSSDTFTTVELYDFLCYIWWYKQFIQSFIDKSKWKLFRTYYDITFYYWILVCCLIIRVISCICCQEPVVVHEHISIRVLTTFPKYFCDQRSEFLDKYTFWYSLWNNINILFSVSEFVKLLLRIELPRKLMLLPHIGCDVTFYEVIVSCECMRRKICL